MHQWPRLALKPKGATTFLFTATVANQDLCELVSDDFNFELCLRKLSLEQQLRVRNAKQNRVKALCLGLFSQLVLNYVLHTVDDRSHSFEPFEALPITTNEFGKPSLDISSPVKVEYNSSSSNEVMAIVVQLGGEGPIGIDLSHESQDGISSTDFLDQFRGIFAPTEVGQLEAIKEIAQRYVFFNQLWTLKEAFTKFLGSGLNIDLASFHFQVGPERPPLKNPKWVRGKHYDSLDLQWQRDIKVFFDDVEAKFKDKISSTPVRCQSSILKSEGALPVYISLVGQSSMDQPIVISINLADIVREIIGV